MAHKHAIAYLDALPDDVLSRILRAAQGSLADLDDRTPWEERVKKVADIALYKMERPDD